MVDFSLLLISLFSVTCIFRSLDLASSVSASNVVLLLSLFLYSFMLFSKKASFLDPLEASLFKSCKNMDLIVLSDSTS